MTRRLLLAAVGWAAFGGAGCCTCRHEANQAALCPTESPEVSCSHRGRVHLIVLNGCDLLDVSGLSKLQAAVNAAGFSKVHVGQTLHSGLLLAEARRVQCNDPHARFVVAGYDLAAEEAESLASAIAGNGAAVDAVVLLDPMYLADPVVPTCNTVVIKSAGWLAGRPPTHVVTGVGHLGLPTHPAVVQTLTELLTESLAKVPVEEPPSPTLPLVDDPAPLPVLPVAMPKLPPPSAVPIPSAPKAVPGVLTTTGR